MNQVQKILMERDELSETEAKEQLAELIERCQGGENPEELLREIGLEPDYIFDIMP